MKGLRTFVMATTAFGLLAGATVGVAAQDATPTVVPMPSGPATPATMPLLVGCSDGAPCELSAGTWTLTGDYSFILGMEVTVPDGWRSLEQDAGEFTLFPLDHPNDHIFMVKDIAAVTTDGSFRRVLEVPSTAEGLTAYWQQDPNLVVSEPMPTTIAGGIDAITYVVSISPDAKFADPGCPFYPRCADLFTDPRWWNGPYGFAGLNAARFYLATVENDSEPYLFMVGLEAEDEAALERLTVEAAPIIESIRLPDSFPIW